MYIEQVTVSNEGIKLTLSMIITLCSLIFILSFSGCHDLFNPFDSNNDEMGLVNIFIGDENLKARTTVPNQSAIAGYQLTFSGGVHEPVNIIDSNQAKVFLPNGNWTINATAYKLGGEIGNTNDAVAIGSISVSVVNGQIIGGTIQIILKPIGTGNGTFHYSININTGITGSLTLWNINGNTKITNFGNNGDLNLSSVANNGLANGFHNLTVGRYIAEVKLTNTTGNIAYRREVIEIWQNTFTTFAFEPSVFYNPILGNQPIDSSFIISGDSDYVFLDGILTIIGNGTYTIEMKDGISSTTMESIAVSFGITANITLVNVSIDMSDNNISAFDMTGATVNLTLVGENVLVSGGSKAGIHVPDGSTLIVTDVSSGSLLVTGGYGRGEGGAGIGGSAYGSGGNININGGTIIAIGDGNSAGIGGGYNGSGGIVNISGGIITADGNNGIGGGYYGEGSILNITGGTVTAKGLNYGIGGFSRESGSLERGIINTIKGNAVVIASSIRSDLPTGTNLENAIVLNGSSGTMYGNVILARDVIIPESYNLFINNGQTLTIQGNNYLTNNGTIYLADGGNIFGNLTGNQPIAPSFTISGSSDYTYTGGVLTITGNGTYTIGMRSGVSSTRAESIIVLPKVNANITLSSVNINRSDLCAFDMAGATVNLTLVGNNILRSGSSRAGLEVPNGSTLIITAASTGSLTAISGDYGAGIGGGSERSGGNITINGGTITANNSGGGAGGSGAGIAGGYNASGGTVNITGGTVTAAAARWGAGIGGGGWGGSGGTLSITGGTVTARGGYAFGSGIGAGIAAYTTTPRGSITTINGNAVIFASSISSELPTGTNLGSAIIFIDNNDGTMYGNVTLQQNVVFASGRVLNISSGQSLTIPNGITLTNNGTINNGGTIYRYGVIAGSGSVTGNQVVP